MANRGSCAKQSTFHLEAGRRPGSCLLANHAAVQGLCGASLGDTSYLGERTSVGDCLLRRLKRQHGRTAQAPL